MMRLLLLIMALSLLLFTNCWEQETSERPSLSQETEENKQPNAQNSQRGENPISISEAQNLKELLANPYLADGFDFPIGNPNGKGKYTDLVSGKTYTGWYIATKTGEEYALGIHTGEDWNGVGGGNTDLGQAVYAIARGKVLFAGEKPSPWGNVVFMEHHFFENGQFKTVYSQYAHLHTVSVKAGELIEKRTQIGTIGQGNHAEYPAHLHLEIRKSSIKDYPVDYWPSSNGKTVPWVLTHYEIPTDFIEARRKLIVPANEKQLVWVDKSDFKMQIWEKGKQIKNYEIALGQTPVGRKEIQGDNKVPEGQYRIIQKVRGPIKTGQWLDAYFGTAWIRLNYPNQFDAAWGLEENLINKRQYKKICKAIEQGKEPPKNTKLGGGIGIHGWLESDWDENGSRAITWGCISMHNDDLVDFFNWVDMQTVVVIVP